MDIVYVWSGFLGLIAFFLFLDLKVFHKDAHAVTLREAGLLSAFWIFLGLAFNAVVYFGYANHWIGLGVDVGITGLDPTDAGMQYFTAYLIEKSLSVDNLFVMAIIFAFFKVPVKYQHTILFWGVLGAIVFRGIMIVFGAALVHEYEWITYIFGGLLLYSAYSMAKGGHEDMDPMDSFSVRLIRKIFPIENTLGDGKFFVRMSNGKRAATSLFLALVVVETTDIVFAVDSIPAVFSITQDPFIAFTSNIFAVMGLRSLYFLLAAVLDKFHYLKTSLVVLLAFIGVKMLIAHWYKFPTWASLLIILVILTGGIVASLIFPKAKAEGTAAESE
jgi:tellurite resistance protein TerC